MWKLVEPETTALSVPYKPDGQSELIENPPRFTWMSEGQDQEQYRLQWSRSADFQAEETVTVENIPYNYHTPDHTLTPGTYFWRYQVEINGDQSDWSQVRSFSLASGLTETPLPSRETRYEGVTQAHPRLWLNQEQLVDFRKQVKADPNYCAWNVFYEQSVKPWTQRDLIPEPARYPNNKREVDLWRKAYTDCMEAQYAIRHLSVAGIVLEDRAMIQRAKKWLLHVAGWDPEGSTSRDYNDESAFRVVGALAWGYDWLYDELTEEERASVRSSLTQRIEQVAYHVIERSKIHLVPYDSHAVRSLSSVIVPCNIVLFGENDRARELLDYAVEYFACLYTPWGGANGGWAEGGAYWTTGMAFVTDAMNLLKKFCGIDFYQRPFFQKTGDFPLFCYSQDTTRASFSDQSNLGERPGLKTGFNIRQFAGITGNGYYQWYYEQVKQWDTDADSKFFNYGWWDFRFDDMMYKHDFPEVQAVPPKDADKVKWFKDIGWVAVHKDMHSAEDHLMYLTKSSPYGSISHSHGDQNSFVLHAYGEPLVIKSGHYIGFNTTMHRNWRRQTRSHNTLLIDGEGQFADINKLMNISSKGHIEQVENTDRCVLIRANATEAYQYTVPYLKKFVRETYFVDDAYFVIVDTVSLSQPGKVDFLLHSLHEYQISGQSFRVQGDKADLDGKFVYSSSGSLTVSQYDGFPDVDPKEWEGLSTEWHLTAAAKEASEHRIVTLLLPARKGERKNVTHFLDDQDHGVNLYFTYEGQTFHVLVNKAY